MVEKKKKYSTTQLKCTLPDEPLVFVEEDGDFIVHCSGNNREEFVANLIKMLREDGYCDTSIMTRKDMVKQAAEEEVDIQE